MARTKGHKTLTIFDSLHTLLEELERSWKVEVEELGTFSIKHMKSRTNGFNPTTNEYQQFPSYNKLSFDPTPYFKRHIKRWKKPVKK